MLRLLAFLDVQSGEELHHLSDRQTFLFGKTISGEGDSINHKRHLRPLPFRLETDGTRPLGQTVCHEFLGQHQPRTHEAGIFLHIGLDAVERTLE